MFRDVFQFVFAQFHDVAVFQEMLLDRLAIDQRAIGAVQVFEKGVVEDGHHGGMFATDRQIVDLDVVGRPPSDAHPFLGQWYFLENQTIHAQYQLSHRLCPSMSLFEPRQVFRPPAIIGRERLFYLDQYD